MPPERSYIIQNPSNRQFIFDIGKLGSSRHYVRGLVEVDVTEALRKIMVGYVKGWIIPTGVHPVIIAIGSLNKQPVIYNGEIQKRDILHLTIAVDHDIVDGIPSARFCDDLVKRLGSGFGLP